MALLVAVTAARIRMGIAHTIRAAWLILRERAQGAGRAHQAGLSWGERAVRLPIAVLYRGLSGTAPVGGIALPPV